MVIVIDLFPAKTRRYYRSGNEMVRMAIIYHEEGNHENAYTLYIKYMTLFLEKIIQHPEYKTYPANLKRANQEKLMEVLPITEKLKKKLLERFQVEYAEFQADRAAHLLRLAEQRRQLKERDQNVKIQSTGTADLNQFDVAALLPALPSAPPESHLDQVVYPNDFPSTANRSTLPSGLLLPDPTNTMPRPTIDRSLKPSDSLIEGNLRTVVVPADTMTRFLSLASRNTSNNVETCGILAGSMVSYLI